MGLADLRLWRDGELGAVHRAVGTDGRPCVVRLVDGARPGDVPRPAGLSASVEVVDLVLVVGDRRIAIVSSGTVEETLADRIRESGPLSPEDARRLLDEMEDALGALHQLEVVHGGVSPSTVVWTGDRWQLTGVGLARLLHPPEAGLPVGEVSAYAAPEVLAGGAPGPAADLYALGLTVVEAVTGVPVTEWRAGEQPSELLARRPTEPVLLAPDQAPPDLAARLAVLTDPDPAVRQAVERAAPAAPNPSPLTDDDVQFTVYRPGRVRPATWYTMLAFAHKTDMVDDPVEGAFDPVERVKEQAAQLLGPKLEDYLSIGADADLELPRGSELRFAPHIDGVEFNPPYRSFQWEEPVHSETFRFRADPSLTGRRARGSMAVFLGTVLVADVTLSISVEDGAADDGREPTVAQNARRYSGIFVSYSHADKAVVERVAAAVKTLGHEVVIDGTHLRNDGEWWPQLQRLIERAEVFQLFWSTNALRSSFVRDEWTYALSLRRPGFIRPVYWEDPFPEADGLPPETLRKLHFHRLAWPGDDPGERRRVAAAPVSAGTASAAERLSRPVPPAGPTPPPAPPSGAPPERHQRRHRLRILQAHGAMTAMVAFWAFLTIGVDPGDSPTLGRPPSTTDEPTAVESTVAPSTMPGSDTTGPVSATTLPVSPTIGPGTATTRPAPPSTVGATSVPAQTTVHTTRPPTTLPRPTSTSIPTPAITSAEVKPPCFPRHESASVTVVVQPDAAVESVSMQLLGASLTTPPIPMKEQPRPPGSTGGTYVARTGDLDKEGKYDLRVEVVYTGGTRVRTFDNILAVYDGCTQPI